MDRTFDVLPYLDPFAEGLVKFVEAHPQFRFMVTHGDKVNPPRNPMRLFKLLTHKAKQKANVGSLKSFTVTMESHGSHYAVPTVNGRMFMRGNPSFNLKIRTGDSEVSISFGDPFKPCAWVVSLNEGFADMGQER